MSVLIEFRNVSRPMSQDRSGIISIQTLWILAIVSFLALGLAIRASLSIKVTGRQLDRMRVELLAFSQSEIMKQEISSADSISCNFLGRCCGTLHTRDSTTLIIDQDTFVINLYPGCTELPITERRESIDEEALINVNTAPEFLLRNLMFTGDQVQDILEYRQSHKNSMPDGEPSDSGDLDTGPFHSVDDLLMLKSISWENLQESRRFLTVFGNGRINMNTAPEEVLRTTGCPASLIEKLLSARKSAADGHDHSNGHLFDNADRIIADLIRLDFTVSTEEANYLKDMANYHLIGTQSEYFSYTVSCRRLSSASGCILSEVVRRPSGKEVHTVQRFLRREYD
jgi:type II secretory pathway component PulK